MNYDLFIKGFIKEVMLFIQLFIENRNIFIKDVESGRYGIWEKNWSQCD